ncbi:M24 family metallopeptidase [Pseudobacillus wudalianchiensis]|uniref:Metallopeptidase n=1 Tax=Pseudobacillus wudalianchiensis TaxID=1743143 RepID=A0A1B9B829_9BACI|nr:Xaa-Pro peptidase family protein [Bacillus wudalianchiensis]OCA92264.1 metallopeptidase [Bacillus wudalianchiensis]
MNKRLAKLMDWMKEKEISFAFITAPENVFYLTGFRSDPHERLLGVAIFPEDEPFLVCPKLDASDAKNSGWTFEIVSHSDIENPWEMIETRVKSRVSSVKRLAVEKQHLNVERYEELSGRFPGAVFVAAEEKMQQLRMIKDKEELAFLKKAAEYADFAVKTGAEAIREGKSELEILAEIEFEMKKQGIAEMSFSTMVLTGKNAASPHGTPGSTRVQKGDLVLFDLGVVYEGYCSDITRTVAFGDISDKQREIYETVLKAEQAAVAAVKPGMRAKEIDLTARNIIAEAGYGDFFPHRLGHGLGISVHEYPGITETNELVLQEGMVFTIEPGIYVPDVAGVRIEDDVYVTADGVEILTSFPKQLTFV